MQRRPLRGGITLDDFVRKWEDQPETSRALSSARKQLADSLDSAETLRKLRLQAGLSQALLAKRAGTTQSHIAHIESGAKDPQTDMIARLATALDVPPERVFAAVRVQRAIKVERDV